jgi:hypothetical protein
MQLDASLRTHPAARALNVHTLFHFVDDEDFALVGAGQPHLESLAKRVRTGLAEERVDVLFDD